MRVKKKCIFGNVKTFVSCILFIPIYIISIPLVFIISINEPNPLKEALLWPLEILEVILKL